MFTASATLIWGGVAFGSAGAKAGLAATEGDAKFIASIAAAIFAGSLASTITPFATRGSSIATALSVLLCDLHPAKRTASTIPELAIAASAIVGFRVVTEWTRRCAHTRAADAVWVAIDIRSISTRL